MTRSPFDAHNALTDTAAQREAEQARVARALRPSTCKRPAQPARPCILRRLFNHI